MELTTHLKQDRERYVLHQYRFFSPSTCLHKVLTRKMAFLEGWSWFKFNNLGLVLGTNLKFCTTVEKGLKLKVRKFWGPNLTFVEVTREKLIGGLFCPPSSWIGLKQKLENQTLKSWKKMFPFLPKFNSDISYRSIAL